MAATILKKESACKSTLTSVWEKTTAGLMKRYSSSSEVNFYSFLKTKSGSTLRRLVLSQSSWRVEQIGIEWATSINLNCPMKLSKLAFSYRMMQSTWISWRNWRIRACSRFNKELSGRIIEQTIWSCCCHLEEIWICKALTERVIILLTFYLMWVESNSSSSWCSPWYCQWWTTTTLTITWLQDFTS